MTMTTTNGIAQLVMQTNNWGKAAAFWKSLGFELDFDTGHGSGQLRHPAGGPAVFLVEQPDSPDPTIQIVLAVDDATSFETPASAHVERAFEAQHWGVLEMLLRDPDGRRLGIQAPLPSNTIAETASS